VERYPEPTPHFASELVAHLYDEEGVLPLVSGWLERSLRSPLLEVMQQEHRRQAVQQTALTNAINSCRRLAQIQWRELFQSTSWAESELAADPAGVYAHLDFETRDRCRGAVEEIARWSRCSEQKTIDQSLALSIFQLAGGGLFTGAVLDGLLLGHWYLTDRKLTRRPIGRATLALIVASVVEIVAIATSGFGGTPSSAQLNPLLTAGALAPWIAIGMAAATLLIAIVVRAALRGERAAAVQSATGFYYLAVVTAFTAEIAVRTRFLPG